MIGIIEIPGEPRGKQRPKFSTRGQKVVTYTPAETRNYETLVRSKWAQETNNLYFGPEDEIYVLIEAWYKIPKSASKKVQGKMAIGQIRPRTKPDFDNIGKIICDSLNGYAYRDDAQICGALVMKMYSTEPRVNAWVMNERAMFYWMLGSYFTEGGPKDEIAGE